MCAVICLSKHDHGITDNETFFSLDPRYKKVREYLSNLYESAVKEWDLDGLKLDFIDSFV